MLVINLGLKASEQNDRSDPTTLPTLSFILTTVGMRNRNRQQEGLKADPKFVSDTVLKPQVTSQGVYVKSI